MALTGCQSRQRMEPHLHASPYPGTQLWAVAPFLNESGVSIVDTARIADLFTEEVQQVDGIDAVPVNRVILAMRQLNIAAVLSSSDATALIEALNVDGLVVGTVTAYDPYNPPTFGLAVQLFKPNLVPQAQLDPRDLTRQATGDVELGALNDVSPTAQAAGIFDARSERTRMWIDEYAIGRTPKDSAYGAEIFLVRKELYTKFVSYRRIGQLLSAQHARVQALAQETRSR
ncbi:MAG: hypothetical protein ACRD6I_17325 [Candidatus Acidiferrales bacterium]